MVSLEAALLDQSPVPAHSMLPSTVSQLAAADDMKEIGQLVLKLSQYGKDGDVFKEFAKHVSEVVPGLTHLSVILLPGAKQSPSKTPGPKGAHSKVAAGKDKSSNKAAEPARLDWQQYAGSTKLSKAEAAKRAQLADPDLASWKNTDCQTSASLPVLNWRTCKEVKLSAAHGAELRHPSAGYPVSCTAACHLSRTSQEMVATPDYLKEGPHFAEWGEMQQQGAVSMASVPITMNNEVVAALALGSLKSAVFDEIMVKRIWVLSFVLAPYTHVLSHMVHVPMAKKMVDRVMPELVERHPLHDHQRLSPAKADADHDLAEALQDDQIQHGPLCAQCQAAVRQGGQAGRIKAGRGHKGGPRKAAATELQADSTAAALQQADSSNKHHDASTGNGSCSHPHSGPAPPAAHRALQDSDLDWGDFFFNLISMCIVYAHFSEAAVVGTSNAAVVFSMAIAGVDITLLMLRWLWHERFLSYGRMVRVIFNLYRVAVLPVANTWMSWSLLHKVGWEPSGALLTALGALILCLLTLGLKVRFFLHAPLQLATVLMAAASAEDICSRVQASTGGAACLGLISALQMLWGLMIPSFLTFMLDFRLSSGFMPHVQAKSWLRPQ